MKNVMLIIISIMIIFLFGCADEGYENRRKMVDIVEKSILNNPFKVLKYDSKSIEESSFHGSFFLVSGEIEGESTVTEKINFWWLHEPTGFQYNSTVPISKLRIKIDNTKKTPIVQFQSDITTSLPFVSSFSKLEDIIANINTLTNEEGKYFSHITSVDIFISEEDLKKEIYLPEF